MGYSHGNKWTDEAIKNGIEEVIIALNLNRMPSNKEVKEIIGNSGLSNDISRNGGFRVWAEKLNLDIKESETSLGNDYEFIVKEILEELGYDVEKMTTKHPYDLLINDNLKVDVKVSRYYKANEGDFKYHTFNLEKIYHNCDIFILVCLNEEDEIVKLLIIPSKYLMGKKQVSVGVSSKYDRFNKKFECIDKYVQFYNEI